MEILNGGYITTQLQIEHHASCHHRICHAMTKKKKKQEPGRVIVTDYSPSQSISTKRESVNLYGFRLKRGVKRKEMMMIFVSCVFFNLKVPSGSYRPFCHLRLYSQAYIRRQSTWSNEGKILSSVISFQIPVSERYLK